MWLCAENVGCICAWHGGYGLALRFALLRLLAGFGSPWGCFVQTFQPHRKDKRDIAHLLKKDSIIFLNNCPHHFSPTSLTYLTTAGDHRWSACPLRQHCPWQTARGPDPACVKPGVRRCQDRGSETIWFPWLHASAHGFAECCPTRHWKTVSGHREEARQVGYLASFGFEVAGNRLQGWGHNCNRISQRQVQQRWWVLGGIDREQAS